MKIVLCCFKHSPRIAPLPPQYTLLCTLFLPPLIHSISRIKRNYSKPHLHSNLPKIKDIFFFTCNTRLPQIPPFLTSIPTRLSFFFLHWVNVKKILINILPDKLKHEKLQSCVFFIYTIRCTSYRLDQVRCRSSFNKNQWRDFVRLDFKNELLLCTTKFIL